MGRRTAGGDGVGDGGGATSADTGLSRGKGWMTPAEAVREKLDVSVFADELFGENCFLIRRRDTPSALVVDPGLQVERVKQQVRADHLEIDRILITHGHIDHIAGVSSLHLETGAPIAMHPEDLAIIDWDQFAQLPFTPAGFAPFSIDPA